MTDLDYETFQVIKNIVTSKEIQTNKELGENYWIESYNKNQMDEPKCESPIPMSREDYISLRIEPETEEAIVSQ
jgi:hypothetical protein